MSKTFSLRQASIYQECFAQDKLKREVCQLTALLTAKSEFNQ